MRCSNIIQNYPGLNSKLEMRRFSFSIINRGNGLCYHEMNRQGIDDKYLFADYTMKGSWLTAVFCFKSNVASMVV